MDLESETTALMQANRDIEEGIVRIERQKELVRRLDASGKDIEAATTLLKTLEDTLSTMQGHRAFIEYNIRRMKRRA